MNEHLAKRIEMRKHKMLYSHALQRRISKLGFPPLYSNTKADCENRSDISNLQKRIKTEPNYEKNSNTYVNEFSE